MNKFLTRALPFTLSMALLASCSAGEEETTPLPETPDSSAGDVVEAPTTPPEGDIDTAPATPPEGDTVPEDGAVFPDEFVMGEGVNIDQAISDALSAAIMAARDEEANSAIPVINLPQDDMAAFLFPMLGFDPDNAQGFAISVSPMNVQAYGIAAILPVEGQEEAVMAGLQQFKDSKISEFETYLADQMEVAQAARLETLEDGTILLVMCQDQDTVFDAIVAGLA